MIDQIPTPVPTPPAFDLGAPEPDRKPVPIAPPSAQMIELLRQPQDRKNRTPPDAVMVINNIIGDNRINTKIVVWLLQHIPYNFFTLPTIFLFELLKLNRQPAGLMR